MNLRCLCLVLLSFWLAPGAVFYFLARGSSLGSCLEARLLWEEGLKSPATAMGTGSFRHGPQEMVNKDVRFGMWIDGERMRGQDLAVARDLRQLGASVMLIGRDLPQDAGNLVFQLPAAPPDWQYLIDIKRKILQWQCFLILSNYPKDLSKTMWFSLPLQNQCSQCETVAWLIPMG